MQKSNWFYEEIFGLFLQRRMKLVQ
ncbi:hypothetical protein [Bacillus methanolicus]